MVDTILENIIPILTGLGGVVGGFITHKYTTINSKTDSIKQLLAQNTELVSEVNRLQD